MKSKLEYKTFYKRNLPHFQIEDSVLFITYRLAFSLPRNILEVLQEKRELIDKKLIQIKSAERKRERDIYNKFLFKIADEFLDKFNQEPLWLKNTKIAKIILDSLLYNNLKYYELHFCMIMPNHVHLVLKPLKKTNRQYYSISKIMKEHKSYTAVAANKILKRNGQFWQHESYDHIIRDDDEYYRIKNYVLNNPVKAGFVDNYKDWKNYYEM